MAIASTSPYGIANNGVSYILEDVEIGNLVVNNFKNSQRMIVATYDSLEVSTPAIERFDLPKTIGKQIVKINQKAKFAVLYLSPSYNETTNGYIYQEQDKKQILYYNPTTQTWEKPVLREWDSIEKHSDGKYYYRKRSEEVPYSVGDESKADHITDMANTVKKLVREEVYECTNLDLITYPNETNLIVSSGVIQPKITLKVLSNVSNIVKLLQEKVSVLENKFIEGLKQVLSGDMMSLAYLLYPQDFDNDNEVKTLEEV